MIERPSDAAALRAILRVATAAGMTHGAIQRERAEADPRRHAVTSFRKLHGAKWDEAVDEIERIEREIDYASILEWLEAYVGRHDAILRLALV